MTAAFDLTPVPRLPRRFLADDDRDLVAALHARISRRYRRNEVLSEWYAQKALVRSLGMAVPAEFDQLKAVVGWPSTVVDKQVKRQVVDHLSVPGSQELTDRVNRIWVENDLDLEAPMLKTQKSIHGIAFNVIARNAGRAIVMPTSATAMTCEYDRSTRSITAALSVDAPAVLGGPRQFTLFQPARNVLLEEYGGRYVVVNQWDNPSGLVPVERFMNRPRFDKPWGSSSITPAVIYYTSAAVRTLAAMEVAREAFAMPKEFLINVAKEAFQDADGNAMAAWDMYWTRLKALTTAIDEDGEPSPLQPDVKQLSASPPTPLIDMLKMYSQLLSTEVGMPPSMFGFVTDQPPSGDSQRFFESDLVLTAKADNRIDGVSWSRTLRKALLADGVPLAQLPPEVKVVWREEATFQPAAITDSLVKKVQVGIVPPDSDVALEEAGYDRSQVERIQADRRRSNGSNALRALTAGQSVLNPAADQQPGQVLNADDDNAAG